MFDASCGGNFWYKTLKKLGNCLNIWVRIHICILLPHILICLGN